MSATTSSPPTVRDFERGLYDAQREQVWDDWQRGRITEERANEMLRVIGEHERVAASAAS